MQTRAKGATRSDREGSSSFQDEHANLLGRSDLVRDERCMNCILFLSLSAGDRCWVVDLQVKVSSRVMHACRSDPRLEANQGGGIAEPTPLVI